jgi:hypothetical protein
LLPQLAGSSGAVALRASHQPKIWDLLPAALEDPIGDESANLGGIESANTVAGSVSAAWYGRSPNKRCVRVREGGEVLQTIDLDAAASGARSAAPIDERCSLSRPSGSRGMWKEHEWAGADGRSAGAGRRLAGGKETRSTYA